MHWFRFWNKALHDRKVQALPGETFKRWVNLLCLASEAPVRGTLPPLDDVAFALRLSAFDAETTLDDLVSRSFLDRGPDGILRIHRWDEYQPRSDSSVERVRRHRSRRRSGAGGTGADAAAVTVTVTGGKRCGVTGAKRDVNALDSDTETETEGDSEVVTPSPSESASPPAEPPPPLSPGAAAAATRGPERSRLEGIAREALGDRFDLESVGAALGAWLAVYPAAWVEPALLEAAAAAPGGKFAAYTHSILLRCKQEGKFVPLPPRNGAARAGALNGAPAADLSPAQRRQAALVEGFRQRAAEARRKEATDGEG